MAGGVGDVEIAFGVGGDSFRLIENRQGGGAPAAANSARRLKANKMRMGLSARPYVIQCEFHRIFLIFPR
jgi:hypothetical protein